MADRNGPDVEVFLRSVNERFLDYKARLTELLHTLVTGSDKDKLEKAKQTLAVALTLQSVLSRQDQPLWLQPIISVLQTYVQSNGHAGHAPNLVTTIASNFEPAANHKWAFEPPSDDKGFDFDGLFRKYEAESQIPRLFDELVGLLEKIVQCEKLDSRRVIHTLETIIATLKKNRDGSYFSVMGSWNFTGTYLKNMAWNMLLEIPMLRVPVKALRETMEQLDKEMEKVHENMQTELHKQLHAEFPVLAYHALPLPEPLALTDETVIDANATPVADPEKQPL
jgi:hypothetical protein